MLTLTLTLIMLLLCVFNLFIAYSVYCIAVTFFFKYIIGLIPLLLNIVYFMPLCYPVTLLCAMICIIIDITVMVMIELLMV